MDVPSEHFRINVSKILQDIHCQSQIRHPVSIELLLSLLKCHVQVCNEWPHSAQRSDDRSHHQQCGQAGAECFASGGERVGVRGAFSEGEGGEGGEGGSIATREYVGFYHIFTDNTVYTPLASR